MTGIRMNNLQRKERYQIQEYNRDLEYLKSDYYNCTEQVMSFQDWPVRPMKPEDFRYFDNDIAKCEKSRQKEIRDLERNLLRISREGTHYDTYYHILVIQAILVVLEFVILITSAGFVCHVCCCCCAASQQMDTTAVFVSAKQLTNGESVVHVSKERENGNLNREEYESRNYARLK